VSFKSRNALFGAIRIHAHVVPPRDGTSGSLGVRADGTKEILGLWLEQNEGSKFWLRVMNELKNRGVEDFLIAVVDGPKGFPDAITAVFPQAMVQTCVVHLLRHSLAFVSWKDRKPVAAALKDIYRPVDADAGETALTAFEDGPYPAISQSWRRAWAEVVPLISTTSWLQSN
jgi:putative transposase